MTAAGPQDGGRAAVLDVPALLDPPARHDPARLVQLARVSATRGAALAAELVRPSPRRRLTRQPGDTTGAGWNPRSDTGLRLATAAAHQLRLGFQDLGPTFVKLGQMISASPGTFPGILVEEMAHCQDEVPPEPWEAVSATLAGELGPANERLRDIAHRPLAAASIAQVHSAELPDGAAVVVKVQRSGLRALLRQDLRFMEDAARLSARLIPSLASANPVGVVEDFARGLGEELDFKVESSHMERLRTVLAGWPIRIPLVHPELTTSRVLTMERLEGVKISDSRALDRMGVDRVALADTILASMLTSALQHGIFHADGHAGNLLVQRDGTVGLLDFGIVGQLDDATRITMSRLLRAFLERRFEVVADSIVTLADVSNIDLPAAVADLEAISSEYLTRPWGQVPMARLLADLLRAANRHRVVLPTGLVLLFKQILYLDGLGRFLNPAFDLFADGARFVGFLAPEALDD